MRVLIACERSGVVRRAFASLGHFAVSVDLSPSEDNAPYGEKVYGKGWHYEGDIFDFVNGDFGQPKDWDLLIAHPECTYLSSSGLHWNTRRPERHAKTEQALDFALRLWSLPIPKKCMENPPGRLTKVMREHGELVQTIQPYQFGHDASKATCLVLKGLPPLRKTAFVEPRIINGRPRWSNQTDSGQNRLGPSDTRSMERARTYDGIAKAMALQWDVPT